MKLYYINNSPSTNPHGNNEVHTENCSKLSSISNRSCLGYFNNGVEAVSAAKSKGYNKADGCILCCPEAHQE